MSQRQTEKTIRITLTRAEARLVVKLLATEGKSLLRSRDDRATAARAWSRMMLHPSVQDLMAKEGS